MTDQDRITSAAAVALASSALGSVAMLAAECGVDKTTAYRWLNHDSVIELTNAVRAAVASGVPLRFFRPDVFRTIAEHGINDDHDLEAFIAGVVDAEAER